ncbi:ABC transporter ATP-binding protein [Leptospira ryugenii]|uniref:ABC transporter ATP-binding protein n=1 Tax=Leptospira ryugenii TaxID=1917863 RepID=A0A2P2DZE2_9LEPT|nr:ABC transporter ATP-binding protein [Leptospira ryugenii]
MENVLDVELIEVTKNFGDFLAVDRASFGIKKGEFFSMLGPSGSGKTTCLRMVAGFYDPSAGKILLGGQDVRGIPPYKRNVNTVFQDYALFPHMSIAENVGYGLMVKNVSKKEIASRVQHMLEMVRLPDVGKRKPSELSGGQRQRIALARALINQPQILLLDEPLGALDLKLREEMQIELKAIQKTVGITFIFVTHDQEEALSMSDRIAVFNQGKVEQIGSPWEIYEKPNTSFVANFVGTSNIFDEQTTSSFIQRSSKTMIRPEKIRILSPMDPKDGLITVPATLLNEVYSGANSRLVVQTKAGQRIIVSKQNSNLKAMEASSELIVAWKEEDMHLIQA